MKLGRIALWVVVAVVVVGGGAWYVMHEGAKGSAPAAAAAAPPPVTVSPALQREVVERDEFTGQFAAVDYVELRARVSGYLQEIHFEDGQLVKKGDLLFVIDPRPFEIQRATAKAQIDQANATIELADRELKRAAELRQKDFVPASTYDQRLQQLRAGNAALDTARASMRDADLNLEFSRITAPISGRIGRHEVSIGNLVSGGNGGTTTLLTSVVSLDPIYFYFDMSEADFLSYQRSTAKGQLSSTRDDNIAVDARLVDETAWTQKGRIDFVDNQVDRGAGTIRVRAVFPNPKLLITPGQFGRIRVPASEPYQAFLVPDSALVTDQSRKLLMTVAADGTVVPKVVRPGPTYGGLRIIREGITPTDQIVINGLVRARPGAKVTPQPGKIELVSTATAG
ncbi:MAG: efflux RND transporter periplasmic adaptor subunit [Alphaproteobacteria bacterium]|nr:efflux RND transporter periplasmic adaptor subunit [Alphaproteobacteria bacterium]